MILQKGGRTAIEGLHNTLVFFMTRRQKERTRLGHDLSDCVSHILDFDEHPPERAAAAAASLHAAHTQWEPLDAHKPGPAAGHNRHTHRTGGNGRKDRHRERARKRNGNKGEQTRQI